MTANSPYILSLDIGTSSVRSKLFDAAGEEVEGVGTQVPYRMERTQEGGEFIHPETLCEIIYEAIDRADQDAQRRALAIAAVSLCTFWHNVAGVDERGTPCTPLLNWSDTRPEIVLPVLKEKLDPTAYTARTGCPMHASYLPAKILWLHQSMPEQAKKARYWMSIGEYLLFHILGARACSYSMASGSGLLHSARCAWDETSLEALPISVEQLSPLCDADERLGPMQPHFHRRWPSLRNAVWFPALGDGACSNIGSGCASPNRLTLMVGTSGAMRLVWRGDYREPPSGLWCYRIDRRRPIQGGALSNGGNLFEWMQSAFTLPTGEERENQLRALPPDGHGLTFLPFLAGQRSPRWNPHKRGTLHGLRLSTQPIHILQAGLEAVAYRFRLIHERLSPHAAQDHILVATGGGLLHSPAWIQILADVIGRPVHVSQVNEASCRGAALRALESLGTLSDMADADPHFGPTFTPRDDAHAVYDKGFQRHLEWEELIAE